MTEPRESTTTSAQAPNQLDAGAPEAPRGERPAPPRRAGVSRGIAILVSLLGPGIGHFVVGRPLAGVSFFAGTFLALFGGVGSLAWNPSVGLLLLGLAVLLYLGSVTDVVRRSPEDFGRPNILLVIVFGMGMLGLPFVGLVCLRVFVIEAFKIPSGAMIPTLRVGDHVFVDKLHRGARAAERGAIVVFPYPTNPQQDFIKRIVGMPGDEIETRGSSLFVNGFELKRCPLGRIVLSVGGPVWDSEAYVEFLGSHAYLVLYREDRVEEPQGWTVKEGEVFVMGDNRDNSYDSRVYRGVPIDTLKGRAVTRFLRREGEGGFAPVDEIVTPSANPEVKRRIDDCLAHRPSAAESTPPPPR